MYSVHSDFKIYILLYKEQWYIVIYVKRFRMWMIASEKLELVMWSFRPVIALTLLASTQCCIPFFLFSPNMMGIMTMIISFFANSCLEPVSRDSQISTHCFQYSLLWLHYYKIYVGHKFHGNHKFMQDILTYVSFNYDNGRRS